VDVANTDGHARKTTDMTCEEITQRELMERYLLGRLEQPDRDAFDEHLFECEACFERLQTLRAVRHELAATADALRTEPVRAERGSRIWKWAFVPTFATLVIIGIVVGPRMFRSPAQAPETPTTPTTPGQVSPAGVEVAELGRFEPPSYPSSALRGSQDAAAARFRDGMTQYTRGDYLAAIPGLRAASRLDPEAAHALFFLGISYVLSGQHDEGVRALRQTIQLGDSPFLEEAHFYLAKAALQQNDATSARDELLRTLALKGPLEQQARQLLGELDHRLANRP
jgi:tetratricopeptide (TPR) repeat protein